MVTMTPNETLNLKRLLKKSQDLLDRCQIALEEYERVSKKTRLLLEESKDAIARAQWVQNLQPAD